MPEPWSGAPLGVPRAVESMLLITVHPGQVAAPVLAAVDGVVAVGPTPGPMIQEFAEATGHAAPALPPNAPIRARCCCGCPPTGARWSGSARSPRRASGGGTCASTPRVS